MSIEMIGILALVLLSVSLGFLLFLSGFIVGSRLSAPATKQAPEASPVTPVAAKREDDVTGGVIYLSDERETEIADAIRANTQGGYNG